MPTNKLNNVAESKEIICGELLRFYIVVAPGTNPSFGRVKSIKFEINGQLLGGKRRRRRGRIVCLPAKIINIIINICNTQR